MRIVHVVAGLPDAHGGPSYSVPALCKALCAQGCTVDLVTLSGDRRIETDGLTHHQFAFVPGTYRLGWSSQMRVGLQALARDADLVHSHGLWKMPNVYAARAARFADKPFVISPRGSLSPVALRRSRLIKSVFWAMAQRAASRSARAFHATSVQESQDIRACGMQAPIAVIPNGIDPPLFSPAESRHEGRRLLYLGRLHPIKGLDELLKAWRCVQDRHPDWSLRLVGPDDRGYLAQLQQLARDLGALRVEFIGARYGAEKWAELAATDLFVLPSHSESLGTSAAEAMTAGVPVIASTGTPWSELETRNVGWLAAPRADAVAKVLDVALSCSPAELREKGERGRIWMSESYSWQRVAREMIEFYHWILTGGTCPPSIRL